MPKLYGIVTSEGKRSNRSQGKIPCDLAFSFDWDIINILEYEDSSFLKFLNFSQVVQGFGFGFKRWH